MFIFGVTVVLNTSYLCLQWQNPRNIERMCRLRTNINTINVARRLCIGKQLYNLLSDASLCSVT